MTRKPIMRLSACDVTSSNALGRQVLCEQRLDRGRGWIHPKDANNMAVFGLNFRKALVGTG